LSIVGHGLACAPYQTNGAMARATTSSSKVANSPNK
jgi:hypothetical protein